MVEAQMPLPSWPPRSPIDIALRLVLERRVRLTVPIESRGN